MDEILVKKAARGDIDAFSELVRLHENRIYSLCLRMMGNPEDAQDAAQEAFIKAWEKLSTFRGDSAFSTWLYRLASNLCLDMIAARNRRAASSLSDEDGSFLDTPDTAPLPQEELERRERLGALKAAMDTLPDEARTMLILREGQGLSYEEIGQVLNLPPGTVKSRLFRAREKLREELLSKNGNIFESYPSNKGKPTKGGGE
ncbi:MAG: sigma-70 family RNA polymerase sigma factor [Oscillospiraceae bacterium]|nr:sigma-70 family RNA polymerase sigma factor [Oscillospiraceae bacterium]